MHPPNTPIAPWTRSLKVSPQQLAKRAQRVRAAPGRRRQKSQQLTIIDELGDDERTESEEGFRNIGKRHSYISGSGTIPPIPISPNTTGFSVDSSLRKTSTFEEVARVRAPPPPPPTSEIPEVGDEYSDETTGYEADEDTDIYNSKDESSPRINHGRHLSTGTSNIPRGAPPLPPSAHSPTYDAPPLPPIHTARHPPPPVPSAPPIPVPNFPPPPHVSSFPPPPPPPIATPAESFDSSDLQGSEESDTTEQYEASGADTDRSTPAPFRPPVHNPPPPPRAAADSPSTPQSFKTRKSFDIRTSGSSGARASLDGPSYIAHDVDIDESSQWWTIPNGIPSSVSRNANNLLYEVDDSQSTKRGGRISISRDIYILYHDYSQSVVTARYEQQDPIGSVSFEQTHTPPPSLLQDQLQDAYKVYGKRVLDEAQKLITQGNTSATFIDEVIGKLPAVLLPIGHRSYGALVYDNLANASIKQFDEIRPGDIVAFKNAHFHGHKGSLHQKYSAEVGKDDTINAGIIYEWDGTKKKIRVYIQPEAGKSAGRIKQESYRLSDLKSGEVRVYRVVGRNYVGWE